MHCWKPLFGLSTYSLLCLATSLAMIAGTRKKREMLRKRPMMHVKVYQQVNREEMGGGGREEERREFLTILNLESLCSLNLESLCSINLESLFPGKHPGHLIWRPLQPFRYLCALIHLRVSKFVFASII